MNNRSDLHEIFLNIMSSRGINGHVYFQPPASVLIEYPAILYRRSEIQNDFADNEKYRNRVRYEITLVDYTPESDLISDILQLRYCEHNRHYTSENLNHDVFTLYY